MLLAHWLALRFGIDTWQEGLQLAGVLWVVDACLNIRWVQSPGAAAGCLWAGTHSDGCLRRQGTAPPELACA